MTIIMFLFFDGIADAMIRQAVFFPYNDKF